MEDEINGLFGLMKQGGRVFQIQGGVYNIAKNFLKVLCGRSPPNLACGSALSTLSDSNLIPLSQFEHPILESTYSDELMLVGPSFLDNFFLSLFLFFLLQLYQKNSRTLN